MVWFARFHQVTKSISNKSLRSRLSRHLTGEKTRPHRMNKGRNDIMTYAHIPFKEHCFKTAFHPGTWKGNPGIYDTATYQTLYLFLSFSFTDMLCTSLQINFRLWVAIFSQVPKLLVFTYLLSEGKGLRSSTDYRVHSGSVNIKNEYKGLW